MHLQLKKVDPFITKKAHQMSVDMGPWAHTLLFLGNTLHTTDASSIIETKMKTNTVSVFSIRVCVRILTAFELEMRVY